MSNLLKAILRPLPSLRYLVTWATLLLVASQNCECFSQNRSKDRMQAMGTSQKERGLIEEVLGPDLGLELEEHHSKLVRTKLPVVRSSVIDPDLVEVTQFDTRNLEIIGLKAGYTDLTLWLGESEQADDLTILRYRVKVIASGDSEEQRQLEYGELEAMINELFPNSSIELVLVADKLVIRGQARDSEEAANILSLIRRRGFNGNAGNNFAGNNQVAASIKSDLSTNNNNARATGLINLLRVPGEQQVLLKVRIAEISRTAIRELGLDFSMRNQNLAINSNLGNAGNLVALLNGDEVSLMMRVLSSNAYSKVLAEPNLVTLSGRTASFIAGGQFAVPTAVGVGGVQAATTFFQGFGTQLQFTPTVLDKDRIRLRVAPTFSSINAGNTVNGIPGLNTRSVFTTVDMREGQWFAVAGLIEGQQEGSKVRVPGLGDIAIGGALFGKSRVKRDETELLILVSPQLVHPLDSESVPSILPGMDVLEPNNFDFFIDNQIEAIQPTDFRSTVWPAEHAKNHRGAQDSKTSARYRESQEFFIRSDFGFAN